MSTEQRTKLKDMLIIVATIVTILLNTGVVFGGMKWITEVNSQLAVLSRNQGWVLSKIEEITKWEHEHELNQTAQLSALSGLADKIRDVEKKISK
jgi:hypothetical protein